jgi:hypothetical protein
MEPTERAPGVGDGPVRPGMRSSGAGVLRHDPAPGRLPHPGTSS